MTKDLALWTPANLVEATSLANQIAESAFAPKEFRNKPQDCLMAMMYGNEIGLPPMASLQSIAVINGRPSVWGDAALALVQNHPDFEDNQEVWDDETKTATCTIQRKGRSEVVRRFSMVDAKVAELTGKENYKKYPARMCQMRARSWAMRDLFPEVFKGISIREEVEDYPQEPRDVTGETTTETTVDPMDAIRSELIEPLKEGVELGAFPQEHADTVTVRAKGYRSLVTLRKYVDNVKAGVIEEVDRIKAEKTEPVPEPEQHIEDVPTADIDAAADEVFDGTAPNVVAEKPDNEPGDETIPETEAPPELDIF